MAKPATLQIKLVSTADTGFYYVTKKNPRTKPEKLELKKYDPKARKHVLSGKPKSSRDDEKRLPMICGIRLTPSEHSIAIISDDGDFVYKAAFPVPDSYTELLSQLASAVGAACSENRVETPIGVWHLWCNLQD